MGRFRKRGRSGGSKPKRLVVVDEGTDGHLTVLKVAHITSEAQGVVSTTHKPLGSSGEEQKPAEIIHHASYATIPSGRAAGVTRSDAGTTTSTSHPFGQIWESIVENSSIVRCCKAADGALKRYM